MMRSVVVLLPLCSQLFTCVHLAAVNSSANPSQGNPVVAALRISDYWTEWYDVDHPNTGPGDYETVDSITSKVGTYICPTTHSITDADCRIDDDDVGDDRKDFLYRPCSTNGLICRNRDQPSRMCNDYSIRFFCSINNGNDRDNSRSTPRFDMRIYIILAAVPVAIFVLRICWSCTFERRRRRLRREARARRRARQEEDIDPEVFMPPPSYQELFGDSEGPFALSRQYSLCRKCRSSQCIIFRNRQPRNSETQNSGNSQTESSDSSSEVVNMAAAVSSPDDTPASSVESPEVTQTEQSSSSEPNNTSATLNISTTSSDNSQTSNNTTGSNERSQTSNTNTSSSESAQTSNTSTSSGASVPQLNPQTVESSRCDCPCHKRAPEVMAYDNPAYEPEVQIQEGRSSRFPGMHLSVFSMFRSPSETSLTEPPPPTYKEALKILKKNQKGKP